MLFSIILPVYNVERYLTKCVESILSQDFKDYEIILVDDGSTDGSPIICDEFEKNNSCIKVIHKKNGGQSDARNVGTAVAQGKYIIYIDSDDFIISNDFLSKVAEKTKNNTDLIFYKFAKYYDKESVLDKCTFSYSNALNASTYTDKLYEMVKADAFYASAWIKAIRRSVIVNNNIKFDVGLVCEDMDWNHYIVYNSHSIDLIDEVFIAYRQREGSITKALKLKNFTDFLYIIEKWSGIIKNDNVSDSKFKEVLYSSLAKYYSNLFVSYTRLPDRNKKFYKRRIKDLKWLLKYGLSSRPKILSKVYNLFGFDITILMLKIIDKVG